MADTNKGTAVTKHVPSDMAQWPENSKGKLSFTDHTHSVVRSLMVDPKRAREFVALINATHNDEAIEGSIVDDDVLASEMVRNHARDISNKVVATATTKRIRHALTRVLKRHDMGRKQRASGVETGAVAIPAPANGVAADNHRPVGEHGDGHDSSDASE